MISEQTQTKTITLVARSKSGSVLHCELQPDKGIFVGTSSNCGLQLRGDGLSEIHCRIGLEEGQLWVQDWMSNEGTRVNGEVISTKFEVHLGDVIQIGEQQITVASAAPCVNGSEPAAVQEENARAEVVERESEPETVVKHEPVAESIVKDEPVQPSHDPPVESSSHEEADDVAERAVKVSPEGNSLARDSVSDEHESMDFDSDFFQFEEEETYDRETVALLQAEIEELQTALAQRDAERFCETNVLEHQHSAADPVAEESDEVLQRMQDLIDEANRSDERVAILEEMLHAAEDANRSEQEERKQLEAWVGDIETRLGQREEEHLAELDALRQRLDKSNQQQERLQRQLQQSAFSGSVPKQYEETLEELQANNRELQEQLAESQKQRLSLEQRFEQIEGDQEHALREERANLAKEQAKIARLRFELSSKLADVNELPKSENQADKETAHRIQTLREHLREIHEQEKSEEKEATLATRLAKLWKRVEY